MQHASAPGGSHIRHIPAVTPRSPRNARHWAASLVGDTASDAISELLTNVLRYAPGPARLTLTPTAEGIEVAVADRRADGIPNPVAPGEDDAEHGWGLFLLAAMSVGGLTVRTWTGGGKEVAVIMPLPKEDTK